MNWERIGAALRRGGRGQGRRIVISNFSHEHDPAAPDAYEYWRRRDMPRPGRRVRLFDYRRGWGFHMLALGVHLLEQGLAGRVEFWEDAEHRRVAYDELGVLRIGLLGLQDALGLLEALGPPDLFVNYGSVGAGLLTALGRRCFRAHVPCGPSPAPGRPPAECYLVDRSADVDDRAILYVPPINAVQFSPKPVPRSRDFVYLATADPCKRHDIVIEAVRGTGVTGHFHPVSPNGLDLAGTEIRMSAWDELNVPDLLASSRIAVYAGDRTSNPAAMWECVATGLPLVVNRCLEGGQHVVVPGVTGELASPDAFGDAIRETLARRSSYRPRAYYDSHWQPLVLIHRYLDFFRSHGWGCPPCS